MFAYHLHTPTQRGRSFVISHNSPCLLIVCRPHRLFALLHCAIHVYTHRFGFRGGSVLHLSLPIQVRIHPTHVATRATYAYALALFVLTRHSFTRKRTLSFGHTCPVVLFARVGQYINGRPVVPLRVCVSALRLLHALRMYSLSGVPAYGLCVQVHCAGSGVISPAPAKGLENARFFCLRL